MKILQIHDNYERLGGAETYLFNLIDLLKKNRHKVFTFAIKGNPKETKDTLVVGEAKGFFPHYFSCYVFNFKVYFKLKRFIKKVKPDIIHIHNNYLAPFSVLFAVRGYKVVQTVHDYMIICPCGWMVNRKNLEPCHARGSCFVNGCLSWYNALISYIPFQLRKIVTKKIIKTYISPSKLMKKYLESFSFQNARHLPYFLDVESFRFRPRLKKRGNILYVGRLTKEKGAGYLIKAMPKIIAKIKQANLTIVGDGSDRQNFKDLSKDLGVSNRVHFVGKVPHEKVKQYYQGANVVIVPSICFDNSPNVIYEAFSSGRPVIASDRGGMSDFVKDGKTGFIFRSGDIEKLAERVMMVLKDKAIFNKLSVNCRKFSLLNFASQKHYQEILRIYNSKIL